MQDDILDLSNPGPEKTRVKLPDGNVYELLGQIDVDPVFNGTFGHLSRKADRVRRSSAVRHRRELVETVRQQALLVCPGIGQEYARTLPFQVATGIVARFLDDVGPLADTGGVVQMIADLVNRIVPGGAK